MSQEDSVQQFLESAHATEIDFNSNQESKYPFRVKFNNHWFLGSEVWKHQGQIDEYGESIETFYGYQFYGKEGYAFLFPEKNGLHKVGDITIAEKENKKYLISLDSCTIDEFWFHELQNNYKTVYNYYEQDFEVYFCSMIRRGEKWALGLIHEGNMLQLSPFDLKKNAAVDSVLKGNDSREYTYIEHLDIEAELISIEHAINTDKLLSDRPNVSQVIAHDNIYEVWENNLVGFYNDDLTKNQPIEYDDIEVVNLDYMNAIALQKNGKWSFYNISDATLLFESQAATINELIDLWLDQ